MLLMISHIWVESAGTVFLSESRETFVSHRLYPMVMKIVRAANMCIGSSTPFHLRSRQTMHRLCFNAYVDDCRALRHEPLRFHFIFEQLCNGIGKRARDSEGHTNESNLLEDEWLSRTAHLICNNAWMLVGSADERAFCRSGYPHEHVRQC